MNILQVMGMDSTKYGGIERFNVEIAKQIKQLGHKVIFVYESLPVNKSYIEELEQNGASVIIVNSKNPLLFSFRLAQLIIQQKIDVLHAHFTKARFYAIPIAYVLNVKKILFTIHSTMCPFDQIKRHTKLWFRFANRVSKVIAVSKEIEKQCRINWLSKIDIETLYLGVKEIRGNKSHAREQLGLETERTYLTTIANFNKVKGLDVLCDALYILNQKELLDNTTLLIVGQTKEDLNALEKQIKQLQLTEKIKQIGISEKIEEYLIASDIYIQSSRNEGLPLSLMEAANAYLPIVATNVGGIPEIVIDGENGFLVEKENPKQLAGKIELLLKDNELREKTSDNNRKILKKFQVKENVKKLLTHYSL